MLHARFLLAREDGGAAPLQRQEQGARLSDTASFPSHGQIILHHVSARAVCLTGVELITFKGNPHQTATNCTWTLTPISSMVLTSFGFFVRPFCHICTHHRLDWKGALGLWCYNFIQITRTLMSRHKALPDTIKKQGGKLTLTSTSLVNFSCGCYMNFCSLKRFIGHHSENGKIVYFLPWRQLQIYSHSKVCQHCTGTVCMSQDLYITFI